jgi:uncharacterized tellurite resistance protein B-like protein
MLARLLSRLAAPAAPAAADPGGGLALAALLVRVARSDAQYTEDEARRIEAVLHARYGLSPFEAAALRGKAERLEAEAPDTVRFTRAIKDSVPHEAREAVLEALWSVALADGGRSAEENQLLRLAADLLGVSDRDSNLARRRAEGAP